MKLFKSSIALFLACALLLIWVPAVSAADTPAMTLSVGLVTRVDEDTVNVQIRFDTGDQYFLGGSFTLSWDPSQVNLIVPQNAKGQDDVYQLVGSYLYRMAVSGSSGGAGSYIISFTSFSGIDVTGGILFNLTFTLTDPDITVLPLSVAAGNDIQVESIDGVSANVGDVTNPLAAADNTAINVPDYIPYVPQYGDVDGSGKIDTVDARTILQYAVGAITSLPYPLAADVSGNGKIDTVDARMVLQSIVGKLTFGTTPHTAVVPDPVGDGSFTLSVGKVARINENTVNVVINYNTGDQHFINGMFILNWDPALINLVVPVNIYGQIDPSQLVGTNVSRMTYIASPTADGSYAFAFAAADGIDNTSGALLNLTFTLLDPNITVLPLSISIGDDLSVEDMNMNGGTLVSHVTNPLAAADNTVIRISSIFFKDPHFEAAVRSQLDLAPTDPIDTDMLAAVDGLDLSNSGITNFSDLQYFPNIYYLDANGNNATSLDLSKNLKLQELDCSDNKLTSLDVTANTDLYLLVCSDNQLASLSYPDGLEVLMANNNRLASCKLTPDMALLYLANNPLINPSSYKNKGLETLVLTESNKNHTYIDFGDGVTGEMVADGTDYYADCFYSSDDFKQIYISVYGSTYIPSFINASGAANFAWQDAYIDSLGYTADLTGNKFYFEIGTASLGDVNYDGKIDTVDARLILQNIVGKAKLDDVQKLLADVNGDNKIDTVDARLVLQYIVGKLKEL